MGLGQQAQLSHVPLPLQVHYQPPGGPYQVQYPPPNSDPNAASSSDHHHQQQHLYANSNQQQQVATSSASTGFGTVGPTVSAAPVSANASASVSAATNSNSVISAPAQVNRPVLQQVQQLFQKDMQTITPEAIEGVKAALASSEAEQPTHPKKRAVPRKAAGFIWEDPTLADWPDNDHRLFCGDLGNEVNDEVLTKAFAKYSSFNMARMSCCGSQERLHTASPLPCLDWTWRCARGGNHLQPIDQCILSSDAWNTG
ncbi:hypothetical protein CBR_g52330 [Chara braunii]|uniref:RRM domain-containing protein n=1 Tax=Chara braunii TaxID=69332 RepID=A0A388K6S6_CHABU|nr:hypothetical protein CBR_g52330 [Chara braunii]|eukprot:GBG65737.1 hypothetical protein CBR_g52330 [Chara braunii]